MGSNPSKKNKNFSSSSLKQPDLGQLIVTKPLQDGRRKSVATAEILQVSKIKNSCFHFLFYFSGKNSSFLLILL